MLRIVKLYSSDNAFHPIEFELGLNLICGDKSKNEKGEITSSKQNGVGKTMSVELINFCFLKKRGESPVFDLKEEQLPTDSFVNLHFQNENINYIISRNRKNKIRIKKADADYKDYEFEDARNELNNILGFGTGEISARDYLNFMIKQEDYSYTKFGEFYKSNYTDLMKIHFYFFDIPTDILEGIGDSYKEYDKAVDALGKIRKELETEDLDLQTLRAKQNAFEAEIETMEKEVSYQDVIKNLEKSNVNLNEEEMYINQMMIEKKQLEYDLKDIDSFISIFDDDFYIDNSDVELIFNRYKPGLGELLKKDLEQLKLFKDQLIQFKGELMAEKKNRLLEEIDLIEKKIGERTKKVDEYYKDVLKSKQAAMVKNFKIYKTKTKDNEKYTRLIQNYDSEEKIQKAAKSSFNNLYGKLEARMFELTDIETSFTKTFTKIHEAIMKSSECSFKIHTSNTNFSKKSNFFKFEVTCDGGGKGVNQTRAVIYDLSLLENPHTNKRHLGCLIHDNLIFGTVDKDSSISVLNYLNSKTPKDFQYIATVNKDDFDYADLHKAFNFDVTKSVRVSLTKEKDLFYKNK